MKIVAVIACLVLTITVVGLYLTSIYKPDHEQPETDSPNIVPVKLEANCSLIGTQEEILMLEDEVEQGKEALRLFANETQQEKNKLNCRINDLEDELAEKDKLNYDNQHEMEQLVDEALLKEKELTDLKTMLNSHHSHRFVEELKDRIAVQTAKFDDHLENQENLQDEVVKIQAAFEAEQAKVKELQVQMDIQESVIMNLGDTETSVPSTPVNSPRARPALTKIQRELRDRIDVQTKKTVFVCVKNSTCKMTQS